MMERRGEGGVGEPTQLCKDLITAQVSTTWTRSSGMKRCCDMRLPFKRRRHQSFATSSSQEEKVAPLLLRKLGSTAARFLSADANPRCSAGGSCPKAKLIDSELLMRKSKCSSMRRSDSW